MELQVLDVQKNQTGYFSLILQKPQALTFYPGQFIDIVLTLNPPDPRGNSRSFTIASSPTEDFLMISSRVGISKFKQALQKLKPGQTLQTSHPAGTFTLEENDPAVVIAGGVGITPFRSMIKYAVDLGLKTPILLIYSNSGSQFLFKEELDQWQTTNPGLKIHYIDTKQKGRLTADKLPSVSNCIYYLAGSPKMVDDVAEMIKNLGVDESNIRYDRFDGY